MPLYSAPSARDVPPFDSHSRGPTVRLHPYLFAALLVAAPTTVFAQTTTTSPAKPAPSAPTTAPAAPSGAATASGSPTQFSSQSDAASKCSGDTVVWANSTSKALHLSGDRYFGKSKHGFYACEKDAMSAGYHIAGKHHKHAAKSA
jgi:hypothetical protein